MSRGKRINYIDNIRWIVVLLLVFFHGAMAFNSWENNYILFKSNKIISSIAQLIWPWFMPILFLIAGVGTRYSLKKRDAIQYILQRAVRLLLPVLFGVMFIIPIMTYYADVFHNKYNDSYYEHFEVFFTNITDFTGYDGAFTIGHLWFLLALFIISAFTMVIIKIVHAIAVNEQLVDDVYDKMLLEISSGFDDKKISLIKYNFLIIVLIGLGFVPDVLGKNIALYLAYFLIGYYSSDNKDLFEKISAYRIIYLALSIITALINVYLFLWLKPESITHTIEIINQVTMIMAGWFGVFALIGYGKRYLDYTNKFTEYMSKQSMNFYVFHFPILIVCQYYISLSKHKVWFDFLVPIVMAYVITLLMCLIYSRINKIPYLISLSRIYFAIFMLIAPPFEWGFWILYILAGITDILDGFFARKLNMETKVGSFLDWLADMVYIGVTVFVLWDNIDIPSFIWILGLVTIGIRALTMLIAAAKKQKSAPRAIKVNKFASFCIFMFLIVYQLINVTIGGIVVGTIAIGAALYNLISVARIKNDSKIVVIDNDDFEGFTED